MKEGDVTMGKVEGQSLGGEKRVENCCLKFRELHQGSAHKGGRGREKRKEGQTDSGSLVPRGGGFPWKDGHPLRLVPSHSPDSPGLSRALSGLSC